MRRRLVRIVVPDEHMVQNGTYYHGKIGITLGELKPTTRTSVELLDFHQSSYRTIVATFPNGWVRKITTVDDLIQAIQQQGGD